MRKPLSTKVHGALDYMTAGFLVALPRAMGWSKTVTHLLDSAAAAATGYSLLTRYELGAAKVLPMKAHLTLDALSGGTLLGAAVMLEDEDPEVRATLAGLGLFEIAAALLTRTEPDAPAITTTTGQTSGSSIGGSSGASLPVAPYRLPAPQGTP